MREHLDEVQKLRSERGLPLLDPADPKTKRALQPITRTDTFDDEVAIAQLRRLADGDQQALEQAIRPVR